jgi:hypothetical protein
MFNPNLVDEEDQDMEVVLSEDNEDQDLSRNDDSYGEDVQMKESEVIVRLKTSSQKPK